MGNIRPQAPVKLILGISTANCELWDILCKDVEKRFSAVDHQLEWYDFDHTGYYRSAMGDGLKKKFVSFQKLIAAESLPDIKVWTNAIEAAHTEAGRRRINLDPGYVDMPKLVLATTKDYSHRIYLGKGIFGDIHLTIRGKSFQPNPWTYPDYREAFVRCFFDEVRELYARQLRIRS